jgi:predicted phage-related endonuclease
MGNSEKGESNSYKVSWASASRNSFDSKRFAEDYSNMDLSKYYKQSSYRTFKVTEVK